MTSTIASDRGFGEPQQAVLATLAELMIPAADGMPSAADPAIFAEVLTALGERADVVRAGLEALLTMTAAEGSTAFTELDTAAQLESVAALRSEQPVFVATFEACVAACYYRDDRVLRALDLPARAPFPEGHAVPPTDWSLLDPVRRRDPFYRKV